MELERARATEIATLQSQLAELPQLGSSGIVNSWINARIRGHWSKGEVKEYLGPPSHNFKVMFEEFKQEQADQDGGLYNSQLCCVEEENEKERMMQCEIKISRTRLSIIII